MAEVTATLQRSFKETEIGLIPAEWDVVPLSQVAEYKKATINPQSHPDEVFDYYSIPAYQVSEDPALERGGEIRSQKLIVEPGMVLFGKLNPRVPKVWHVTSSSARRKIASTEFIPLVPVGEKVSSEFLYYLAWSDYVLPKSQELVSGSTPSRQRVDVKAFLRIPIPLPPLPQQRRIAHILSTIQRAIAAQDDLIAAAREVKRSLMQRLFTYGPGAEPAPTKETKIGEMPEHWEVVPLIDIVEKTKQREPRKTPEASFQYIDVSSVSNKMFQIKSYTEYRGAEAPSRARRVVKSGDVIFATVRPYLKRIAVVPNHLDDQICSTAFCVIRARKDLADHKFIFYLMLSDDFVNRVSEHQRGSSYPAVSNTDVLNQSVPLPTLDEQREIACILSSADRKIEAEEQCKAALQALFKSMLHQLMTGQLRLRKSGS